MARNKWRVWLIHTVSSGTMTQRRELLLRWL